MPSLGCNGLTDRSVGEIVIIIVQVFSCCGDSTLYNSLGLTETLLHCSIWVAGTHGLYEYV